MSNNALQLLHTFVDERNISGQIEYAVGYGSGVMEHGDQKELPGLDVILVVKDTHEFHKTNLKYFSQDYSFLKYFGAEFMSLLQETAGGISYNIIGDYHKRRLKYGVVSTPTFIKDNRELDKLYVGGRIHKPLHVIKEGTPEIKQAIAQNLTFAARIAFLMLAKDEVTYDELFEKITSLSYLGDPRPEHPHKIRNIVQANRHQFHALYRDVLTEGYIQGEHGIQVSADKKIEIRQDLPKEVIRILPDTYLQFSDQVLAIVLEDAIKNIVEGPATLQIYKGALTAKLSESIPYAFRKIGKLFAKKNTISEKPTPIHDRHPLR